MKWAPRDKIVAEKLEPEARFRFKDGEGVCEQDCYESIAVSLKRIADALEKLEQRGAGK